MIARSGSVITDVISLKPMVSKLLAFIGLFLLIIPWLCSAGALLGLSNLIGGIRSGDVGDAAAKSLLTMLLNSYALAGLSAMIGIMFLGFAVDGGEYRPRWLFWVLLMLGIVWLPLYAAGTMLGIALILYTLTNYRKFYQDPENAR